MGHHMRGGSRRADPLEVTLQLIRRSRHARELWRVRVHWMLVLAVRDGSGAKSKHTTSNKLSQQLTRIV